MGMDQHDGKGGSYAINGAGDKVLTERTDHNFGTAQAAPAAAEGMPSRNKKAGAASAASAKTDQQPGGTE